MRSPWEDRVRMLASHVRPGESVLDVGAGSMALEEHLPAGCSYRPLDRYLSRSDALVVDMDECVCFPGGWDVAVLSGILEHLARPLAALSALGGCRRLLLSYATLELHPSMTTREANGWRSHLTRVELAGHLGTLGRAVATIGTWGDQELLEARW